MNFKYQNLNEADLLIQTERAARDEQNATFILLEYLCEVDERRAFARDHHTSLFDYLVRALKYSESQAAERVAAVRLMRKNESARESIQAGSLNLTNAAQIQRFIQSERKISDQKFTDQRTNALITTCSGKSKRDVEKILFEEASIPTKHLMRERIRQVSKTDLELKMTLNQKQQEKLNRAKELMHTDSVAEMFERALDALIEKKEKGLGKVNPETPSEPIQSPEAPPAEQNLKQERSRYIPRSFRKILYQRSKGQCEYRDTHGVRCASKTHLEIDHILPMAEGGKTKLTNLRFLCRNHNQYRSRR